MNRPEQYVGVSGVVAVEQQVEIADIARELKVAKLGAFVMYGVQASTKTQVYEVPTRYGEDWHVVGDNIKETSFTDETGLTRPYIHIFGGDSDRVQQFKTIWATTRRTREFHEGLQLNRLDWQKSEYDVFMNNIRNMVGDIPIVLQCHERVMGSLDPSEVVDRLRTLKPEYVLFDVSHGKGKVMNASDSKDYIDAVYQSELGIGVVVAGGLNHETIHDAVGPLYEDYPDISVDTEGKMRSGEKGSTYLDLDKVAKYMEAWVEVVSGSKPH
jgi:phosphoribosylanthranilate isomerase